MGLEELLGKVRCVHRKGIDSDHVACFAVGNVVDKREDQSLPWYMTPGYKIGFLDIETDGLKADFSTMLTWCIKPLDSDEVQFSSITKGELFRGDVDKRVVADLVKTLSEYKILIGYYSSRFDIPYIRSKALHHNIEFPKWGEIYTHDLYDTVKRKLKLSKNSLDNACDYLGIKGKTPIDKDYWRKAKYGDHESLEKVLEHNIADVKITEELYKRTLGYRNFTKTLI